MIRRLMMSTWIGIKMLSGDISLKLTNPPTLEIQKYKPNPLFFLSNTTPKGTSNNNNINAAAARSRLLSLYPANGTTTTTLGSAGILDKYRNWSFIKFSSPVTRHFQHLSESCGTRFACKVLVVFSNNSLSTRKVVTIFVTTPNRSFGTFSANMAQNSGSLCRQNYHEDCEAQVNKQINMELYASYVYMSMSYYFDRDDLHFPGLHKYFKKASDEEREHAEKFMSYQNRRGGRIVLQPISKPVTDEWISPLDAITAALELEKTVNQTLLDLHAIGNGKNDVHLCDFLETHFLDEQVESIKELSGYVTELKRVGKGLGEYIFDKHIGEDKKE